MGGHHHGMDPNEIFKMFFGGAGGPGGPGMQFGNMGGGGNRGGNFTFHF